MTLFQSIILGIVQGATEFLPISSSGHLVIIPFLFGWDIPNGEAFIFNVLVQLATLVAVFAYFWHDLLTIVRNTWDGIIQRGPFQKPEARLGWYLVLATLPAVVLGLVFKEKVERAFDSPLAVALFLLVTAVLLIAAERLGNRQRYLENLTWKDALVVGFFQVLALFPGVSRSGATITGGMVRDQKRTTAARFSFLMSVPVMLAAGFIATLDLLSSPNFFTLLPTFIPGFLAAAIVGYLSIRWLMGYLSRHPLYIFAIYCTLLSLVVLTLAYLRG